MTDFFDDKPEQSQYPQYFFDQERTILKPGEITRRSSLAAIVAGPEAGAKVQGELESDGRSPTQVQIQTEARTSRQEQLKEDINNVLLNQDIGAQEKAKIIREQAKDIQAVRTPSMLSLMKEKMVVEAQASDANAEQVQQSLASYYDDMVQADELLKNAPAGLNWEGGVARQLFDFAAGTVLPGFGQQVYDVIDTANPGFASMATMAGIGVGDTVQAFKHYLRSLPPEEREQAIRRTVEAIDTNTVLGSNSNWTKYDMMQTILEDYNDEDWEVTVNNVFGVIDYAFTLLPFVGPAMAKGLKGAARVAGKKLFGSVDDAFAKRAQEALENTSEVKSPLSISRGIEQTAPEEAKALDEASLADPSGEMAKAVGTTNEQITSQNILPSKPGDPVRPGIDLNDVDQTSIDIIHRDYGRAFVTNEELSAMQGMTDEIMKSLLFASPQMHLSRTLIEDIPGGYVAKYLIEDSSTRGFSTIEMAEETAKSFKEYDKATARVMVRDPSTDEFVNIDQVKDQPWFDPNKGEFAVQVDVVDYVSRVSALPNVELFQPNSIVGRASAWLDKSSVFMGWLTRAGNVASEAEAAKQAALMSVIKPMTRLKARDQQKIIGILDEGDRYVNPETGTPGKWWSNEELETLWAGQGNLGDLIKGYQSVVRHQQLVRKMLNDASYKKLSSEGYKHVILPKEVFGAKAGATLADASSSDRTSQLGKTVGRNELLAITKDGAGKVTSTRTIKRIWDAVSKRTIEVSDEALDALNETGDNLFVKFYKPIKVGNEYLEFMVMRGGKGAEIRALPKEIIRDIPGYISRIYDAPYILKMRHKSFQNGYEKESLQAIRMYTTKGEALRDAKRMQMEAPDGVQYIAVEAKELREDLEWASRSSLEYLEYSGQLFTSSRGLEIKGLDGKRRLRSVADSIAAARARAAKAGTIDALVDKLTANWEKKFGQKYGELGRMPFRTDDIRKHSQDVLETEDFNEAIAFQRHIKMLAGVDDTSFAQFSRETMVKLSDEISTRWDNQFANDTAAWLATNRNRNVVNGVKGAAFTHFIIFNPIRQLWMQAQQASVYLGLDYGAKYFFKGEGIRDTAILTSGAMFHSSDDWAKHRKILAQSLKMPEDQIERLVTAYEKSGFNASVDTHMYAMFSNVDRVIGKAPWHEKPWQYFNNVRRVSRRFGFDAGEKFQLMGAWLAVRNKWIKENPAKAELWDKPGNLEEIMGKAREVSFNMNKTGMMQFQRGALGAVFQFLSHATKATQVLIPTTKYTGKLSNKAFNNREKAKIAAMQFAIYGTGGFGIHEMFEKAAADQGIEIPPEFGMMVSEGLHGTILNHMFRALDEEGQRAADLELSSTVAPFSGIGGRNQIFGMGNPAGFLIDALFISDKNLLEVMSGPAYALGTKMGTAMDYTAAVLGMAGDGVATPREATIQILDEWGRQMLPIYNNFIRARAEAAYDRHVSNKGNLGVEVSTGEAWAQGLFSFQPRRQRQVSEELIYLRGLPGHPKEEALGEELDDAASQWYQFTKRKLGGTVNPAQVDPIALLREAQTNAIVMADILAPDEHRRMFNTVRKLILNDVSKDRTELELTKKILSLYGASVPDLNDPEYVTKLENFADFERKQELINILKEFNQWQTIE